VNRIDACFQKLRGQGRTAFIAFLTAGDPDLETTERLVLACARAGASIVELGFPYSDPVADGPTIQASYTRVLEHHQRVEQIFDMVRSLREETDAPLVGMVSYSIIYRRGLEQFVKDASRSGLDGLIVPDLPVDETDPLAEACARVGLANILLVAPTTTPRRRGLIAERATGFIYCISTVGTTGARSELPPELVSYLDELRRLTGKPLSVGFGISRPEQAAVLASHADGVIVGSAIVRLVEEHGHDPQALTAAVEDFVAGMVGALGSVSKPAPE